MGDARVLEFAFLRDRLARYVLAGEGEMMSLPGVLDEMCRILDGASYKALEATCPNCHYSGNMIELGGEPDV